MSNYTLTVLDTTGIQDYIFGTNHLKQNIGASYLVDCATRKWVVESLPPSHNVLDLDNLQTPFTDQAVEDGNIQAEVVYAGGGNTMILFADHAQAVKFAHRLTRKVLLEAPGLQVVLAHYDFDWYSQALGGENGVVQKVIEKVAIQKVGLIPSSPMLGLGVTAACAFTGLPAVSMDEERLISAEVVAKLKAEPEAHGHLKRLVYFHDYDCPKDFDDFGREKEESSYIAVVHADGNEMGKRIQRIRNAFPTPEKNRDYVQKMRVFSVSVRQAAMMALQSTVDRLADSVKENDKIGEGIELKDHKLPFRPIVFGGDDVTFVCNGRLGLSLAAHYLEQFSGQRLDDGENVHCRAGVAVVKTHYPFAYAYVLAEDLCKSGKGYIKQRQEYGEKGVTAMDWHFAVSGLVQGLEAVRRREYEVDAGKLLMRPVRVTDPDEDWCSWRVFSQVVQEFQTGQAWAGRRNKVKALRAPLRSGPQAVENFRKANDLDELPAIPGRPNMVTQGWQGGRCGYFDAIEALDFFVPLEGDEQL